MNTNVPFKRLCGHKNPSIEIPYRQDAIEYKKIMDLFSCGHSPVCMTGFYQILVQMGETKREVGKSGTCEMIAKRQNTSSSFHRVCETFTIFCFSLLLETSVYFAVKKMQCS